MPLRITTHYYPAGVVRSHATRILTVRTYGPIEPATVLGIRHRVITLAPGR